MFNIFLNRAVYEIMLKILYSRTDHTMRIAYWIPKSTDTQSECVIRKTFPLQQLLHERASVFTLYLQALSC